MRRAFREAAAGAPGPVHLESQEAAELDEADRRDADIEQRLTRYPPFRHSPEPEAIQAAAQVLSEAARPIVV